MNNSSQKGGDKMQKLLMLHIDKECDRLSDYGNLLISVKRDSNDSFSDVLFEDLANEFDDITERLSNLTVAVLKCDGNTELLKHCIKYINEMSFMIMNFIVKVMEYEQINK